MSVVLGVKDLNSPKFADTSPESDNAHALKLNLADMALGVYLYEGDASEGRKVKDRRVFPREMPEFTHDMACKALYMTALKTLQGDELNRVAEIIEGRGFTTKGVYQPGWSMKDLTGVMSYPIRPSHSRDAIYFGLLTGEYMFRTLLAWGDHFVGEVVGLIQDLANTVRKYQKSGLPSSQLSFDSLMELLEVLPSKGVESKEFTTLLNHFDSVDMWSERIRQQGPSARIEEMHLLGQKLRSNKSDSRSVQVGTSMADVVRSLFQKDFRLARAVVKTVMMSNMEVTDESILSAMRVFLGNGQEPSPSLIRKVILRSAYVDAHRTKTLVIEDRGDYGPLVILTALTLVHNVDHITYFCNNHSEITALGALIQMVTDGKFDYKAGNPQTTDAVDVSIEEATPMNVADFRVRKGRTRFALVCARESLNKSGEHLLSHKFDSYQSKADSGAVILTSPRGLTPPHHDAYISAYPQIYLFTKEAIASEDSKGAH